MPPPAAAPHAVIDLGPLRYPSSLETFRMLLEEMTSKVEFLLVGVRTPAGETVYVQVRHQNAYLVGFKGADSWYSFDGEPGAWGPPCGTGSNYNQLGKVGNVTYDDLKGLGELARFRKGGGALDKRLCAILIAVTSEAARFATVATHFTGLTNAVGTIHSPYLQRGVDFEALKNTYFKNWEKPTPYVARDILVPLSKVPPKR